jgi:hypothetical protein
VGRRSIAMRQAMRMAGGLFAALTLTLMGLEAGGQQVQAPEEPAGPETAGVYIVRPGDNLWSLSGHFLKNPFFWPKIWERNRFVVNPNRIYPGDPLLIPGYVPPPPTVAALPAPGAIAPAPAPPAGVPPEPSAAEPPAAGEPATGAEPAAAQPPTPGAQPALLPEPAPSALAPPPAVVPIVNRGQYICLGFIHEGGSLGIGTIVRPLRDSLTIGPQDTVFLSLRSGASVQVGEVLQVVKRGTGVSHPRGGWGLGNLVRGRGLLQVTEVQNRSVRATVIYGCEDMAVGDFVQRYQEAAIPELGTAVPTTLTADGMIVHADLGRISVGESHIVYIDLGSKAGIVPGDIFSVHRETGYASDPRAWFKVRLAPTLRGELVVIRVAGRTATARVLRSDLDLHIGDRVRLVAKMP